jgi:hypothetical protein
MGAPLNDKLAAGTGATLKTPLIPVKLSPRFGNC